MQGRAKVNAMRSGLIVIGAGAFGYLTLQLGFKPFLEKAAEEARHQEQLQLQHQQSALQQSEEENQQNSDERLF